jgi:competence protein ComEC
LENSVKFKYNWLNTTWQGTAIGLASQVFTVPVSVYYFSQFPNYFILTNFGVMLFSGIMLALAIGLLAVGKWAILSLPVGWFLAICCSLLVGYIAYIEQIPGALSVGFSPHWSWVLLMYLVVFFALYWSERGKWMHILIAFTPLIMWLQLERYNNLSKRELVIFNSNYPTLLFNTGTEKICFYSGNERGEKQAHRLVNDYSKLHPGEVEFLPLSNGKYTIHIADRKFQIQSKFGWIDLTTATEKYALITASKFVRDTFESDRKLISLQKQSSENTWYDLSDGALHLKLNN